jgi:hypothetical protein
MQFGALLGDDHVVHHLPQAGRAQQEAALHREQHLLAGENADEEARGPRRGGLAGVRVVRAVDQAKVTFTDPGVARHRVGERQHFERVGMGNGFGDGPVFEQEVARMLDRAVVADLPQIVV